MPKVLLVTYYWPPAGGPGVQRVLKFAKYLRGFGWEPVVLTVQDGEYSDRDESLVEEIPEGMHVYHIEAWEPYRLYRRLLGKNEEKIPVAALSQRTFPTWKTKIAHYLRKNLFVPDARIGWIPYAIREGQKVIREEGIEMIFSTSPPPTVHLIAQALAQKTGAKWVADFRDLWTGIHYYSDLKRFPLTRFVDERMEQRVLTSADAVVAVGPTMRDALQEKAPETRMETIYNGYDEEDFEDILPSVNKKFTITHVGHLNFFQIPYGLLETLSRMNAQSEVNGEYPGFFEHLELVFVGDENALLKEAVRNFGLEKYTRYVGYVPHRKAIEYMCRSDVLLLIIDNVKNSEGIISGKLFEYIRSGGNILGIGPMGGDANEILWQTEAGVFTKHDCDGVDEGLYNWYLNWEKYGLIYPPCVCYKNARPYDRKNLTRTLANLFDKVACSRKGLR